jgi:hypothetical protein
MAIDFNDECKLKLQLFIAAHSCALEHSLPWLACQDKARRNARTAWAGLERIGEQSAACHPPDERQRPPQLPLQQERGPAKHGRRVEQQHVRGAVESSAGARMCASGGEDDTARSHQAGEHERPV